MSGHYVGFIMYKIIMFEIIVFGLVASITLWYDMFFSSSTLIVRNSFPKMNK